MGCVHFLPTRLSYTSCSSLNFSSCAPSFRCSATKVTCCSPLNCRPQQVHLTLRLISGFESPERGQHLFGCGAEKTAKIRIHDQRSSKLFSTRHMRFNGYESSYADNASQGRFLTGSLGGGNSVSRRIR